MMLFKNVTFLLWTVSEFQALELKSRGFSSGFKPTVGGHHLWPQVASSKATFLYIEIENETDGLIWEAMIEFLRCFHKKGPRVLCTDNLRVVDTRTDVVVMGRRVITVDFKGRII